MGVGDITRTLFGGSEQESRSFNRAFPQIQQTFGPMAQTAPAAQQQIAGALGLGGGAQPQQPQQPQVGGQSPLAGAGTGLGGAAGAAAAGVPGGMPQQPQQPQVTGQGGGGADSAFQNFLGSTGFQSQLDAGTEAITGNAAASGLLQSGSTLEGVNRFGQELAKQEFNNFLTQLQGLREGGIQAGQLVSGAGQTSRSSGSSQEGAGGFVGNVLGSIGLSDARAKHIGPLVGTMENGIEIRHFRYKGDGKSHIGVVAQQVQPIMPEAVMELDGWLHVDYGKIAEAV